jgi:hypothetical protein
MVVLFTAPHNWDSMTCHLARVAYYLQHGNLDYFDANYWAQVVHPKNSILLLLYTYLMSCGNENLTQIVQFISYWAAVCAVYGISLKVGSNRTQGLFAALVFALLTECLMECTTTQNDMILTAYSGSIIYSLLSFRETNHPKYLFWAALGIGIAIGIKSSFLLVLPVLVIVSLYALIHKCKLSLKRTALNLLVLGALTIVAISVFALPAGYLDNYRRFNHPIGPESIRKVHSFEGKSVSFIIINGTRNLFRFGFDFLSLDGLPPIPPIVKLQQTIREIPAKLVRIVGLDLERAEAVRQPFRYQKPPSAHEDLSSWGIFGFGLILIVVLLSVLGLIRNTDIRLLSFATLMFLLIQSYAGPWDPWRGRYFLICAVIATPVVGVCLKNKFRFIQACLILIVFVGCLSAVSAVLFRINSLLCFPQFSGTNKQLVITSVFSLDRLRQLTRNRLNYYEALKNYEELVPENSVVAVYLGADSYEYPLFGKDLNREVIPINSFSKGIQPIPEKAEYLIYSIGFPYADKSDIHLGEDWYLRKLKSSSHFGSLGGRPYRLVFSHGWHSLEKN